MHIEIDEYRRIENIRLEIFNEKVEFAKNLLQK